MHQITVVSTSSSSKISSGNTEQNYTAHYYKITVLSNVCEEFVRHKIEEYWKSVAWLDLKFILWTIYKAKPKFQENITERKTIFPPLNPLSPLKFRRVTRRFIKAHTATTLVVIRVSKSIAGFDSYIFPFKKEKNSSVNL